MRQAFVAAIVTLFNLDLTLAALPESWNIRPGTRANNVIRITSGVRPERHEGFAVTTHVRVSGQDAIEIHRFDTNGRPLPRWPRRVNGFRACDGDCLVQVGDKICVGGTSAPVLTSLHREIALSADRELARIQAQPQQSRIVTVRRESRYYPYSIYYENVRQWIPRDLSSYHRILRRASNVMIRKTTLKVECFHKTTGRRSGNAPHYRHDIENNNIHPTGTQETRSPRVEWSTYITGLFKVQGNKLAIVANRRAVHPWMRMKGVVIFYGFNESNDFVWWGQSYYPNGVLHSTAESAYYASYLGGGVSLGGNRIALVGARFHGYWRQRRFFRQEFPRETTTIWEPPQKRAFSVTANIVALSNGALSLRFDRQHVTRPNDEGVFDSVVRTSQGVAAMGTIAEHPVLELNDLRGNYINPLPQLTAGTVFSSIASNLTRSTVYVVGQANVGGEGRRSYVLPIDVENEQAQAPVFGERMQRAFDVTPIDARQILLSGAQGNTARLHRVTVSDPSED